MVNCSSKVPTSAIRCSSCPSPWSNELTSRASPPSLARMLMDKISADMKDAMRAKDAPRLSTLRMLKSAVEYHKIEKKQEQLTDADVTAVIKKQIKQRQDSIDGFEKGGRADLVEKEKAELLVLKAYLPEELSQEKVEE